MKGLLPQDFRSQSRSRRLLAIWKKSDISAVLHLSDRFIDLVWYVLILLNNSLYS
ncbi:hypothetical protein DPEC_G00109100 [Dallia pectoralis]|uniref:Uncharacterized protein n=1 Tax=Dallia pectoralis TaxID=75939 RepID=A0ACC2GSM1_DALPE|nr:hypothetical protein DPEC_G00109100 [Dallia pectoralis]